LLPSAPTIGGLDPSLFGGFTQGATPSIVDAGGLRLTPDDSNQPPLEESEPVDSGFQQGFDAADGLGSGLYLEDDGALGLAEDDDLFGDDMMDFEGEPLLDDPVEEVSEEKPKKKKTESNALLIAGAAIAAFLILGKK